jgi:polysaccharide export outer membrane protein
MRAADTTPPPPVPSPAGAVPAESPSKYILGPDDQVKIWALGVEEASEKPYRVDPSGYVDIPVAGQVHVAGMTVEQLRDELMTRFAKSVLHPQVTVEIVEYGSQPVSVMGAVNQAGVKQVQGHKTLEEVLSLAGGLRQDAGGTITISRQIQYGPIPLLNAKPDPTGQYSVAEVGAKDLMSGKRPAENILISPHDTITVPTGEVVYVMGEVKKSGEVPLRDRGTITVTQALASAEGYGATPAPKDAKIVRLNPDGNQRTDIPVNLTMVLAGKAEDIAMRPNDILVVPPSAPKKVALRITEAAIETATGVIIWRRP